MQTTLVSPMEWAQQEFGQARLGDPRRTRRLVKVAQALAQECHGTLADSFSDWSQLKAAYRLMENPAVDYQQIIVPHWSRTQEACSCGGEHLLLEDTTSLDFTGRAAEDLGMIGDGRGRGLFVHTTLALRVEGWSPQQHPQVSVAGLLWQQVWARRLEGRPRGKRKARRGQGSESDRWAKVFLRGGPPPGCRWTLVADRESDMYEAFERCRAAGADFIIRAAQRRALADQDAQVFDAVAQAPALGRFTLDLRARPGQAARQACVELRALRVTLRAPQRTGGKRPDTQLTAVEAREVAAPAGAAPIHWVLLTRWRCDSLQETLRVVHAYSCRWLIEEYHKALKSGAGMENSQLGTAARIESLLGLLAVLAVRLLDAKLLAATRPQEPVNTEQLGPEALRVLELRIGRPAEGWTNRSVVRAIARLGGFIGRKGDGEPGWQTIWRGFQRLMTLTAGFELGRTDTCG